MRTRTDERYSTRWGGRKCSMSTLNTEKANFARLFEWVRFLLGRWKQTNNFQRLKSRTGYRSYFSLGSSQFLSSCLPWSLSLLKLFYYIVCRRPCVLPRRRPSYTNIIHIPNITISLPTRITLLLYSQAATAPDYRSIAFSFRTRARSMYFLRVCKALSGRPPHFFPRMPPLLWKIFPEKR